MHYSPRTVRPSDRRGARGDAGGPGSGLHLAPVLPLAKSKRGGSVTSEEKAEQARASELSLRRERTMIPERIAAASSAVQNMRGNGKREGDPTLEEALSEVRALIDRRDALPELILESVVERCAAEAEGLHREVRELAAHDQDLQRASRAANEDLRRARAAAVKANERAEANQAQREALWQRALPLEVFVRRAAELSESGEARLRLLEEARVDGLLTPMAPLEMSLAEPRLGREPG